MAMPIGRRSPLRAKFGEEDRNAEADRNGDQHRDERSHQRAVDRAERAQHRRIGRRRPALRPQERKAVFLHRRPCARDQGQDDAAEDQQHRDRADPRDPVKRDVAELERVERLGAIVRSGGFHYIALNGHVCHANPLHYTDIADNPIPDRPALARSADRGPIEAGHVRPDDPAETSPDSSPGWMMESSNVCVSS